MNDQIIKAASDLIGEYDMCPAGATVLCAVSGGADSMCLLHLLLRLGHQNGFSVCAAHYNHQLRGAASDEDQRFVAAWCAEQEIPCAIGTGDVRAEAARLGRGLEDAARTLRYAFLQQAAEDMGAIRIATAHHADDNLETLLLRLTRGSGLSGLTGIPPRRGNIVRPLLEVSRADILSYLEANGVPHREDASNGEWVTPRNRLRQQVIPVLRELNPNLAQTAARMQRGLRQDEAYLNAQAAKAVAMAQVSEYGVTVFASALARLPEAVAIRAARRLLTMARNGESGCTAAHLQAVVALARGTDPSAQVDLPGGIAAWRNYHTLTIGRKEETVSAEDQVLLPMPGAIPWGRMGTLSCVREQAPEKIQKNPALFYVSCDTIQGAVAVRTRMPGDVLPAAGRKGTKTVKKWMIENRVPRLLRDHLPVLEDQAGIVAVFGVGVSARCAAKPGEEAWRVALLPEEE